MNKTDIKILLLIIIFIIAFIYLFIIAFIPTEREQNAYNRCIEEYDKKTCQKLVFGSYR